MKRRIILFDGVCNFCEGSVLFIIRRDPVGHFRFASLQSETGEKLRNEFGMEKQLESLVLIEDNQYYKKSTAALNICRSLKGAWRLLVIFLIIPAPIRDYFYDIIAKNRYKWFGKKDKCMIPSPEIRSRFLD
ncbi:thiol-disulfide oxidoreductase DCC family protein [Pseudoneobacillus sp. C159]